jgi:hypothetical protein
MSARWPIFFLLLLSYGILFSLQETRFPKSSQQLSHPLPPAIEKAALGYLRQLGGEMHFVKAGVFYGGVKPGRDPLEYAEPFAQHLTSAASLHPNFADTYFLCQATLPYINKEFALQANSVLALGMAALPDNFVPPFFIGFNHFYHLKDPRQAAIFLQQAAQYPGVPSWVGHLASTLAAEGGDIYGGLIWLKAMLAAEEDERVRERYQHSIAMFERAVTVRQAIDIYKNKHNNQYPATLDAMVPEILAALPEFDPPFQLSWEPPTLRLIRESRTK